MNVIDRIKVLMTKIPHKLYPDSSFAMVPVFFILSTKIK